MGACWPKCTVHPKEVSYEEAFSWKSSFEKLMNTKAGQTFFHDFLKTEHSAENLDFWWTCEEFKQIMDQDKMKDTAMTIFMDFLSDDSRTQISVDCETANDIAKAIDDNKNVPDNKISREIFDKAQSDIYRLMSTDSYSRFITSDFLKNKLKSYRVAETALSSSSVVSEQPN